MSKRTFNGYTVKEMLDMAHDRIELRSAILCLALDYANTVARKNKNDAPYSFWLGAAG